MTADTEDLAKRLEDFSWDAGGMNFSDRSLLRRMAAEIRSKDEEIAAKDARIKELVGAIRALYAEYDKDECCDYQRINRLIEAAAHLLPEWHVAPSPEATP